MDKSTFQEAILADYIRKIKSLSGEKLINELIQHKWTELESLSVEELSVEANEQRRK